MKSVRFGDLCKLQNGRAFKPEEWSEEGTPIVRIQNLNDETKPFNYCNFDVEKRFWINSGDLLFSWSGTPGTSFGAFFWNRGKGFLNQHIFRVDVKEELVDKHYLRYALNSLIVKIIDQAHGGVGLKHITKAKLEEVQIPLPPLAEQRRIAAILDQADELRQKRQQAIEKLDQLLQATFIDMFGDPVSNPKGWQIEPLKNNILHANNGLSRRRKELENVGDIVLRLQDVHYDGIHFDKELNRISLDDSEKKRFSVDEGDILFIRVNGNPEYVGRSAVFSGYKEPIFHNDHLIRIKLSERYIPNFLSYCFNTPQGKNIISKQIKTSAGQHTVSQGGIEIMKFYIPPIKLQEQWTNLYLKIEDQKKKLNEQLDMQNQLFSSLQNQAFNDTL